MNSFEIVVRNFLYSASLGVSRVGVFTLYLATALRSVLTSRCRRIIASQLRLTAVHQDICRAAAAATTMVACRPGLLMSSL